MVRQRSSNRPPIGPLVLFTFSQCLSYKTKIYRINRHILLCLLYASSAMRCYFFLLVCLLLLVEASVRQKDNQVLAQYEKLGQCYYYLGYKQVGDNKSDDIEACQTCTNDEKSSRPCKGWCKSQGKSDNTGVIVIHAANFEGRAN